MGGYESLLVYRLAVTIHDLTVIFCKNFFIKVEIGERSNRWSGGDQKTKHC